MIRIDFAALLGCSININQTNQLYAIPDPTVEQITMHKCILTFKVTF